MAVLVVADIIRAKNRGREGGVKVKNYLQSCCLTSIFEVEVAALLFHCPLILARFQ